MEDVYQKLAYDYDEFDSIEKYSEAERTFLEKLFTESHVEKVLDCACGTGQHLLMLSEAGFQVSGSDFSAAMIDMAKKNLESHNYHIPLKKSDFRFLETAHDEKFDAVICMSNSLPHLTEDEDLVCALTSMKNRLKNGGLLVLTSGTTEATLKLPPIETVVNREDFSRIFVKEYDGRLHTINIVDLYHSKERLESNQYKIIYRVLLEDDYQRLLLKAGFKRVDIYGDYDKSPYQKESRKLIVVGRS